MYIGIMASIIAGALWGLTFIAPLMIAPYSSFDLTIGRYVVFGLISLALLAFDSDRWILRTSFRQWYLALSLGGAGNSVYYALMSMAIPRAGTSVVALIIGCIPVVLAIIGRQEGQRVPLSSLFAPLAFIAAGLCTINWLGFKSAEHSGQSTSFVEGIALTLLAVISWSWYALKNAECLEEFDNVTASQWTVMTGIGASLSLFPLAAVGIASGSFEAPGALATCNERYNFLLWSSILGVASSFGGTWAWSIATRRLNIIVAGQLIVFETLFAILYDCVYRKTFPTVIEGIGVGLVIVGISLALRRRAPDPQEA